MDKLNDAIKSNGIKEFYLNSNPFAFIGNKCIENLYEFKRKTTYQDSLLDKITLGIKDNGERVEKEYNDLNY